MTPMQRLKLVNSLVLAVEHRAQKRFIGTEGCALCNKDIAPGELYRSGTRRRAHSECVRREAKR